MKINFFLYRTKTNSYGTHPVYCRIRINSTFDEFSTGVFVSEAHWMKDKKRVSPKCDRAEILNDTLIRTEIELTTIKNALEATKVAVTAHMIKREFKTKQEGPITFLDMAQKFLRYLESRIGVDNGIEPQTFVRYKTRINNLVSFLQKAKLQNSLCEEIRTKFITHYEAHLKTNSQHKDKTGLRHNTAVKYLSMVKRILKYAKNEEVISENPLSDYAIKSMVTPEPIYLDEGEIKMLTNYVFDSPYLRTVCDCYLFCCATGIGYRELYDFSYEKHIYVDEKGDAWLRIQRRKVRKYGQSCYIPLMSRATKLIEKYPKGLPVPSNQQMNRTLKQIFQIVDIGKTATTHTARKTAANYWYDCGISEETIADCLGNTVDVLRKHYLSKNNKLKRISNEFKQLRDLDRALN